jgi:hypothetical protein
MADPVTPLLIGSSLLQAGSRFQAGRQSKAESQFTAKQMEVEAKGEELGAIQREGDRKQRLAKALASQIAGAGARGIAAFEGSPLTVLQEDIKTEQTATERDAFNSRLSALTKRVGAQGEILRGKGKSAIATQSAAFGLLGDAAAIAQVS